MLLGTALIAAWPSVAAAQRAEHGNGMRQDSVACAEKDCRGSAEYFFYRPLEYGSATVIGALPLILNRGFHVSRISPGYVRLSRSFAGANTFWQSVSNPIETIETSGGWKAFLRTEVFPFRWDLGSAWVPNYVGHTIESGIAFRTLAEYYGHRGVAHPRLMAAAASLATTVLVEMWESERKESPLQKATVADFWLFDPLGPVLFSSDGVSRFFAQKLGARIWPHQPGISVRDGVMTNVGLDMAFKVGLPFTDDLRLFGRVGYGNDMGLSWHRDDGLSYSVALGWFAANLRTDPLTGDETIEIRGAASLFIDRNESLLASVVWTTSKSRAFTVNLYPGALPFLGPDLGAWVAVTGWGDRVFAGLSHRRLRGLGLGW